MDCIELHLFLNNSTKAYQRIISNIDTVIFEANIDAYANLEIISKYDTRFCSAQFNFYGEDGISSALSVAGMLDDLIPDEEVGYRISELYGGDDSFRACVILNRGRFHRKRDELFDRLWRYLYDMGKLHMRDFSGSYEELITGFKEVDDDRV